MGAWLPVAQCMEESTPGIESQTGEGPTGTTPCSVVPALRQALPDPPNRWPWEGNARWAEARERAIRVIREKGRGNSGAHWSVDISRNATVWWNVTYSPTRAIPDRLKGVTTQLIDSVTFSPTYLGDEIFGAPTEVDDRFVLTYLTWLPDCRILTLEQTSVTDRGLAVIDCIPYLVDLRVGYEWTDHYPVRITDEGMAAVGRHPSLRRVSVSGAPVTDAGIAAIAKSQTVKELFISSCPVTPECLVSICKMPIIDTLTVKYEDAIGVPKKWSPDFSRPISPEVAKAVAALDGRLKSLRLEGIEVHPSLLAAIAKIRSLTFYVGPSLKPWGANPRGWDSNTPPDMPVDEPLFDGDLPGK